MSGGIKSKNRMEKLLADKRPNQLTSSQPTTIPSPRKAAQMYQPTVEETILTKNDTKLELKIYNKYFGNQ